MRKDFIAAIKTHQAAFGLQLSEETIQRLADYYDLVIEHNPLLHLVGPCSPEEFAIRHILESLTLLEHLPANAKFADVGAGAGLPSVPCLLVREDLTALLIESKLKKAKFLTEAIARLGLMRRARIVNRQFEEADHVDCKYVTCRALDGFTRKLPRLIRWSISSHLLLFGGENLDDALHLLNVVFTKRLIPLSERRFLFVILWETEPGKM